MENLLEKWGHSVHRFRWVIIAIWMILAVVGGAMFSKLPSVLSGGGWEVQGSQSLTAANLMAKGFTGRGDATLTLVVNDPNHVVGSQAYSDNLKAISNYLKRDKDVDSVLTWLDAPEGARDNLVDKHSNHTTVGFVGMKISEGLAINQLPDIQNKFRSEANHLGVKAYLVGTPAFWGDVAVYSQKGLGQVEVFVLPLVLFVLLMVFRSLVAAITPLLVTVTSVMATMGIVYFTALHVGLSLFITNAVAMLGLGLGIDYALFIVSRFKSELSMDHDPNKAVARALRSSGHVVFFSGITVMVAMAAMFVVHLSAIRSIALGFIVVVLMGVLSSLTLLPACLVMLGERIHKGQLPFLKKKPGEHATSKWYKWSFRMMKRPVMFLLATVIILFVAALPALHLKIFTPDPTVLPADAPTRQGYNLVQDSFGVGAIGPVSVVVHSTSGSITSRDDLAFLQRLSSNIQTKLVGVSKSYSLYSVDKSLRPDEVGQLLTTPQEQLPSGVRLMLGRYLNVTRDTAVIDIDAEGTPASDSSTSLVHDLQTKIILESNPPKDLNVYIGGLAQEGLDANQVLQDGLPIVLGLMLAFIYIVLLVTFRSVFLPLKAIAMNLLSVSAAYGLLVYVFGQGHGANIFHVETNGYIQNFVPMMLLALLFSLSTDYEVFLISRIREEWDAGQGNEESIARGIAITAPLISGAAFLLIAVFGGFAFSNMLPIQTLGFGVAVAIAIDAVIVRFILVPIAMKLMGRWNWWFPGRSSLKQRGVTETILE